MSTTTTILRWCSGCEEEKPLDAFTTHPNGRHGRSNRCRPCKADYDRQRYQERGEEIRARVNRHRAENPEEKKRRDQAYREKNREALAAKSREWYAQHQDEYRAYFREYYQNNPEPYKVRAAHRRALLKDALVIPFTPEQLDQRMSMWGYKCWICRETYEAVDHVKPLSKGGPHILANLRPICTSCNNRKSNTWPFPTGRFH